MAPKSNAETAGATDQQEQAEKEKKKKKKSKSKKNKDSQEGVLNATFNIDAPVFTPTFSNS